MTFGEELKKRREEKGLSIRDLEKKIGISDTMITRYEKNIRLYEMSLRYAHAISKYFRWDIRHIMSAIANTPEAYKGKT